MAEPETLKLYDLFDDKGRETYGHLWTGEEIKTLVRNNIHPDFHQPFGKTNDSQARSRARRIANKLEKLVKEGEDIDVRLLSENGFIPIRGDFKIDEIYIPASAVISGHQWIHCRILHHTDVVADLHNKPKEAGAKEKHKWLSLILDIQRHLYKNGSSSSRYELRREFGPKYGLDPENTKLKEYVSAIVSLYEEFHPEADKQIK